MLLFQSTAVRHGLMKAWFKRYILPPVFAIVLMAVIGLPIAVIFKKSEAPRQKIVILAAFPRHGQTHIDQKEFQPTVFHIDEHGRLVIFNVFRELK